MSIILRDGTEILNMEALQNFMENFRNQIESTENSIKDLESEIYNEKVKRRSLVEKNMLTPRDTFKADISESESKIVNYESVLETEKEKLIMYKDILQNNETFNNLLQECSATIQNDLQTYIDTNERAIYSRMAELRDEYSELFAELQNTRGDIENQISDFNNLCDNYRRHDLKKGTNFHQNVKLVNPAFPELGIIYPPISVPIYSSDIKFRFECAKNGIERFTR